MVSEQILILQPEPRFWVHIGSKWPAFIDVGFGKKSAWFISSWNNAVKWYFSQERSYLQNSRTYIEVKVPTF